MKKNRMMRLASVMLVAVLMTTCTISGTFAKYVTEATAQDEARVAAWGFGNSPVIDFELFSNDYTDVVGKGGAQVIAPGTTQTEMVTLNYQDTTGLGAPEVNYTIDLDVVANSIGDGIKANPNIQWSFNGSAWLGWDAFIAAINAYHEDVAANNLPKIVDTGIEIKWQWVFSTDATMDSYDTAMGNANPLEEVSLSIKLIATQVDTTPIP